MARVKNDYGLTPQQEKFCQYVVDEYATDTKGILVTAYRKAYNCKSDAKAETHWVKASHLYKMDKVRTRVEQLRKEAEERANINRDDLIKRLCNIIGLDPLELYTFDEETGNLKRKKLNEIPKRTRVLLDVASKGGMPDKEAATKILVDMLGWKQATEVNVNTMNRGTEISLGFDDED